MKRLSFGESINIFGQEYKIKTMKKVILEGEEVSGKIDIDKKIITISTDAPLKHRYKTFLHEVGHGIVKETGLGQVLNDEVEEMVVDNFAKGHFMAWEHLTLVNNEKPNKTKPKAKLRSSKKSKSQ